MNKKHKIEEIKLKAEIIKNTRIDFRRKGNKIFIITSFMGRSLCLKTDEESENLSAFCKTYRSRQLRKRMEDIILVAVKGDKDYKYVRRAWYYIPAKNNNNKRIKQPSIPKVSVVYRSLGVYIRYRDAKTESNTLVLRGVEEEDVRNSEEIRKYIYIALKFAEGLAEKKMPPKQAKVRLLTKTEIFPIFV